MAVDLFDPSQIENAVGEAFGRKPSVKPAAQPAPAAAQGPNMAGLDQPLSQNLERARAAYKQQYGVDMPITSGVRTRDEQQRLYDDWKAGKSGVYMPLNPAQHPNRQTFHTEAVDIPTNVPESFLNQYGIHRPLGKKDPVHAVLMPTTKQAAAPAAPAAAPAQQSGFSIISSANAAVPGSTTEFANFKPEDISASVNDAFQNPEPQKPQGATGKVANKVGEFFRGQARSAASLGDVLYSPVPALAGMVTYAGARAVQSPEEAAKTQQKVVGALDKPFGKAFGVTETPEYRGEASQRIMNFIGENMGKGADWISQQTGMPKSDVEYYMGLATIAAPGLKNTKPGQAVIGAVKNEAGYVGQALKEGVKKVTPEPVQTKIGQMVETVAPGTTNVKPKAPVETLGGQPQVAPYAQQAPAAPGTAPGGNVVQFPTQAPTVAPGRASVGAAGVPDATIIRQALQSATPEFQKLYGEMPLDKANTPVVMRHLEADSLPIPVRLTEGQATGDLVKISREQNLRGKNPEFANRFGEQNQQLVENVPAIRERAAPDVYSTKTIESSNALIDAYRQLDDARTADISAAYKALEDANGGTFPVDGVKLAQNADALLSKKLKSEFVPPEIKAQLERFKNGEPMTFEQYEAMRTNLAAEIRKAERSGDGNRSMASSLVYQALDDLPLQGNAVQLKPLADKARSLAKERFDALKKDPAYKAAVNETTPADKFFDKYVINGHNKNVNTMIDTLGRDSVGHQHIKAGTINWLSDKAGIVDGKGNFSQANYNKALKRLDDVNNFGAIFDPETGLQLKTLGNVANYTQFQPRGSFVNNSNTLVGYMAEKAAGGLEAAGNVVGLKTIGYPLGSEGRRVIQKARERSEVKKALEPGAGSTLEEIKNKGK